MEGKYTYLENLLTKTDLTNYYELFVTNDLTDEIVISKLKETDLEKIGISSLGHRIKIIAEIENKPKTSDDVKYTEDNSETHYVPLGHETKKEGGSGPWKTVGWLLVVLIVILIIAFSGL